MPAICADTENYLECGPDAEESQTPVSPSLYEGTRPYLTYIPGSGPVMPELAGSDSTVYAKPLSKAERKVGKLKIEEEGTAETDVPIISRPDLSNTMNRTQTFRFSLEKSLRSSKDTSIDRVKHS